MKRRLVIAVTCVPMPPFFLALPLRQMWLPLMGPVPVNSQILAIKSLFLLKGMEKVTNQIPVASSFSVQIEFEKLLKFRHIQGEGGWQGSPRTIPISNRTKGPMSDPPVSIIMRSFNEGWALRETLPAVQAQEYKNWELIVVDSGSTDGSADLIRK